MKNFARLSPFALLALAVLLSTAGCKSNQDATVPTPATDPSAANTAPATDTSGQAAAPASAPAPAPASTDQTAQSQAPSTTPTTEATYTSPSTSGADDSDYSETPAAYAPQPPPALPEYQQPPDPGEGYIWTPGYWNYASAGYYWVPGVWVQSPYVGALWTPGYWGWHGGRYAFYHGYWGRHIGFYGGINYGFGYGGVGYQGGYWNNDHFFYNRAVNNINVTIVHNVYQYPVRNYTNVRVAFNGGSGGIQLRARPAEIAAFREPHAPPMNAQIQIERESSSNRAQFASVNNGRPASFVAERPLAADQNVRPVAPAPRFQAPQQQRGGMVEARPNMQAHPNYQAQRPNEPARNMEARPAPQPAPRMEQQHPAPHPEAPRPQAQERPAPHAAPAHPAPAPREQNKPEERRPQR